MLLSNCSGLGLGGNAVSLPCIEFMSLEDNEFARPLLIVPPPLGNSKGFGKDAAEYDDLFNSK